MLNSFSIVIFSPRNSGNLYFIEVLIKGKSKPFLVSSKQLIPTSKSVFIRLSSSQLKYIKTLITPA